MELVSNMKQYNPNNSCVSPLLDISINLVSLSLSIVNITMSYGGGCHVIHSGDLPYDHVAVRSGGIFQVIYAHVRYPVPQLAPAHLNKRI